MHRPSRVARWVVELATASRRRGKAHKKYEFGAKVALAVTNREGLVVGMQVHAGNPYDGQTLAPALVQVERLTGVPPERCYVDRGYRGHGVSGATAVFVAGRRRGMTPTIKRELRRRSAIEAMLGHMELDGKLARNHLKGAAGDAIHALLCRAGHNLRLILRHLARRLRALLQSLTALDPERHTALSVKSTFSRSTKLDTLSQVISANLTRAALEAAPVIADLFQLARRCRRQGGYRLPAPIEQQLRSE